MAKTYDELLNEYGHTKIGNADLALGRDNPGALETILQARNEWANATTDAERTAAHNKAENVRKAYGQYSGGTEGMDGQYSPTYVKPSPAAQNDNVTALYEKFNNLYGKNNAPTWTPQYQNEINGILQELGNREHFEYNMNTDPLYQQYRDQYVREGQKAMRDSAAQTAALTGGYGSTYGAIAAQQGYDNYLAQLNDRVPQLEQIAYGKYTDELADMYNRFNAYQSEDQRMYGQYLDALNQYNTDRDYAFNSMQAAMNQNNYENEFNRGIFETDRAFNQDFRQQDISNAASFGDWDKVEGYDYDVDFMKQKQALDELQMAYQTGQLGAKMAGATGGTAATGTKPSTKPSDKKKKGDDDEDTNSGAVDNAKLKHLLELHTRSGSAPEFFNATVQNMYNKGELNDATYKKFLAMVHS